LLALIKANPAEANTAMDAKRQVLANWLERASTHGVEYTRWGIAWNRELACASSGRGNIVCQAAASLHRASGSIRQVHSFPARHGTLCHRLRKLGARGGP
jgi:hypothetical protein